VDIDSKSYTMDPGQVENAITKRTKAILPVHLYGQPADLDPIREIASRRGVMLIEDAAQAHGAEYKGRRVGTIGDIGCFSFYPGKNLGAYGEGGALVTNNSNFARTARLLRDWGQERKYYHRIKAYNYRMDGIQGAILRVKLRYLEKWTADRQRHAQHYDKLLQGGPVVTPLQMPYARHVYHIYAIRTLHRSSLQQALDIQGIQTGIHYPIPVHLQEAYSDLGYKQGDFPCSEEVAAEVLSLPMYAELSHQQIEAISQVVGRGVNVGAV
jgi:dTDP-4-amino-4,6-dideoxygalactose transaminase